MVKFYNIDIILDPKLSNLTPGNFIKFNYVCKELNISPINNFIDNFSLLINLYKKNKDIMFIDLIICLADLYFKNLAKKMK